jgi:hypothetical protein
MKISLFALILPAILIPSTSFSMNRSDIVEYTKSSHREMRKKESFLRSALKSTKQTDLINTLNMNGFLCINILNKDLVEYAGSSLSSDIKSGKHFLHYRLCRQLHRRLVDSLSRHTLNRISSNN